MAVDTPSKRASMIQFGKPWQRRTLPRPDGTIDAGDRAHFLSLYSGITLDSGVPAAGMTFGRGTLTGPRYGRGVLTGPRYGRLTRENE